MIAEYQSAGWGTPLTWDKSYIYAGSRLLSTFTNNQAGGETLEFQHPDRLGTKLITNNAANTSFEQSTLPFGTALDAETSGTTNQRFTSYDRSSVTGIDYAVNRSYSSGQGRFTSVDPAQDGSNLYAYAGNDPINNTDPTGLLTETGGYDAFESLYETFGSRIADLPGYGTEWGSFAQLDETLHGERVANAFGGNGFVTNEEYAAQQKPIDGGVLAIVTVTGAYPLFVFDEHKIWKGGEQDKTYAFIQEMSRRRDAETTLLTIGAAISAAVIALPIIGLSGGTTTLGLTESGGSRLLSQFSTSTIQESIGKVLGDANKLNHIFADKHLLQPLVSRFGSQAGVVTAVANALNGRLPDSGQFQRIVNVAGYNIVVQGNVINNLPRIGNFWVQTGPVK